MFLRPRSASILPQVSFPHSRGRSREKVPAVGLFGDAGRSALHSPSGGSNESLASSSGTANFPVRILSPNTQELIVNNEVRHCSDPMVVYSMR